MGGGGFLGEGLWVAEGGFVGGVGVEVFEVFGEEDVFFGGVFPLAGFLGGGGFFVGGVERSERSLGLGLGEKGRAIFLGGFGKAGEGDFGGDIGRFWLDIGGLDTLAGT